MSIINRMKQLAAAGLVAAVMGCSHTSTSPTMGPASAALPVQTPVRTLEQLISKAFTSEEFAELVRKAEARAADAAGLDKDLARLESEVEKAAGRRHEREFIAANDPAWGREGGYYDICMQKIVVKKNEIGSALFSIENATIRRAYVKEQVLIHELLHALSFLNSEYHNLLFFLHENGYKCSIYESTLSDSTGITLSKETATPDSQTFYFATVRNDSSGQEGSVFRSIILEDDKLLQLYKARFMGGSGYAVTNEEAVEDLFARMRGMARGWTASRIITEAQAYAASSNIVGNRDSLQKRLTAILGIGRESHLQRIPEVLDCIMKGYTALSKAGITGIDADIEMAKVAGKSMTPSGDPLATYVQLRSNIANLFAKQGLQEPSEAEIAEFLTQMGMDYWARMARMKPALNELLADSLDIFSKATQMRAQDLLPATTYTLTQGDFYVGTSAGGKEFVVTVRVTAESN